MRASVSQVRASVVGAAVVCSLTAAAGAARDFRQAQDIASAAVQGGTAIEIERASASGTAVIEVEFAMAGGTWLREVTLDAAGGAVLDVETYAAGVAESAVIAALLPEIGTASIDLPGAAELALMAFPGAEVLRSDYAIENGSLLVEVLLGQGGGFFEVEVNAATGVVAGGPDAGGGDVPLTPGDDAMASAIAAASAARPALTAVEIAREAESGSPVWAVAMLNPSTVRVTEVLVSADGARVLEIENDALTGSDLAEMQALASLFPLGMSLTDALASTRSRFGQAEIRAVEFEAQGGSLRVEALIRENGASRWVEFDPSTVGGSDTPGADVGFAAIAGAALVERSDLTLIEIERDGQMYYEATMVSADLSEAVELEIGRDGTVRESERIVLGGDTGEVSRVLSLIGPATGSFAAASDAFTAVYGMENIREIELEVRRGVLVYEATVRIDGALAEVFLPASDLSVPPQAVVGGCPADLTLDSALDFFDLFAFVGAFSGMEPVGDWNADAVFDFTDVLGYLAAFDGGCS